MTIPLSDSHGGHAGRRWSSASWSAWVVLLAAEVVALSIRFDFKTNSLADIGPWWAKLFKLSVDLFQPLLTAAVAAMLLYGPRLQHSLQRVSVPRPQLRHLWPFVLGHLAAFAAFTGLTAMVLGEGLRSSPWFAAWVVAWALAGLATLSLWVAFLLPPGYWMPIAKRGLVTLLAGLAIGLIAWGAGRLTSGLLFWWQPLGQSTLWVVHSLLSLLFQDTVCQPEKFIVGTPSFRIEIRSLCTGYEGIGLVTVFLCVYLWSYRCTLRFPRSFLLLPLGVAVIWLANALRIAALVVVGVYVSPAVALGGFHSQAGWLAFIAVSLGLMAATRKSPFFTTTIPRSETTRGMNPTAAYLAPMLAIVATAMIAGAFTSGFDWFYPLRVLAAGGVLWLYRRNYAEWRWTWSWQAVTIGVVVFALWMILEPKPAGDPSPSNVATGLADLSEGWAACWLVFRVVGSAITVPLAEELAFRGYLTRRLIAADFQTVPLGHFSWFSFSISSALFGVLHGRWLAGTLAGMLYALALYRRGELADAILAHATTNALIAIYVLATKTWTLWA